MIMKSKIKVKAETTSYSYVTLQNAAKYALEAARNSKEGRFFNSLSAMLYSAFSLEAYLNHLGKSEFQNWEKIERYKSPRQKLDMLVEKSGYNPDFSKRPFDTFEKIFDFRKKIVHGKTEYIIVEEIQDGEFGDKPELPTTLWEKSTTLENAVTFVEDSASMILVLHPIFGYNSNPFSTEWKSSWEVKPF
jgi:hypothetical protein